MCKKDVSIVTLRSLCLRHGISPPYFSYMVLKCPSFSSIRSLVKLNVSREEDLFLREMALLCKRDDSIVTRHRLNLKNGRWDGVYRRWIDGGKGRGNPLVKDVLLCIHKNLMKRRSNPPKRAQYHIYKKLERKALITKMLCFKNENPVRTIKELCKCFGVSVYFYYTTLTIFSGSEWLTSLLDDYRPLPEPERAALILKDKINRAKKKTL